MPPKPLILSYVRKLDPRKNRFKLPSEWLGIFSGVQSFMATLIRNELVFYLPDAWEDISRNLLTSMKPEDIQSYSLACPVKIQKNGKISIPQKLVGLASLGKTIRLEWREGGFAVQPADRPVQSELELVPRKTGSLGVYQIPIQSIDFDEKQIKAVGIEPNMESSKVFPSILVAETEKGRYQLVWGIKHLIAQMRIGRETVSAIVLPKPQADEPIWFALEQAIKIPETQLIRLVDTLRAQGYKPTFIAKLLGRSVRTVQRYLVLARAPEHIKNALKNGEIKLSLAYEAIKKNIDLSELKGKTFRRAREAIQSKMLAKAPHDMKDEPVKKMIYPTGDVDLVLNFRAGKDNLDEAISKLQEVIKHLKTVKGVKDGIARERKRPKGVYGA